MGIKRLYQIRIICHWLLIKSSGPSFLVETFWVTSSIPLIAMHAKSFQLCLTLCDPIDCIPPGSSVRGLSRQEYWSGLPCPPPGDLLTQKSNLHFLHWLVGSLSLAPSGKCKRRNVLWSFSSAYWLRVLPLKSLRLRLASQFSGLLALWVGQIY